MALMVRLGSYLPSRDVWYRLPPSAAKANEGKRQGSQPQRWARPYAGPFRGLDCLVVSRAQETIRSEIHEGQTLHTPVRAAPFVVAKLASEGVVVLIGAKQARTLLSWSVLDDLVAWLDGRGWVEVGGAYSLQGQAGKLDGFLKQRIKRDVAGWVAALLEAAGLVDLDRTRPARLRLRPAS